MNNTTMTIWGRELELSVSYDCFDDEEVLQSQNDALSAFLERWNSNGDALYAVKLYCEIESNGSVKAKEIENVFKYVVPKSLFVLREPEGTVAIMCNFLFDIEHGMAIVFKDGKLVKICSQGEVL